MENEPFLSIITINYNNAQGLRKTMQSVFDLNFDDYEYIIIDGGSTDESVSVIQEFLAQQKCAAKISYWVSESDKGIYNAMNKGIAHASGKLLNFMNSGDFFLKDSLQNLRLYEAKYPNYILYGVINKTIGDVFSECYCYSHTRLSETNIHHQGMFIPLSIFKRLGGYDEHFKILADYDFNLRCFNNGERFAYLNSIIAVCDAEGLSHTGVETCRKERNILSSKYTNIFPQKKKNYFVKVVKLFLPFGIVRVVQKIKACINRQILK